MYAHYAHVPTQKSKTILDRAYSVHCRCNNSDFNIIFAMQLSCTAIVQVRAGIWTVGE